MELQYIHIQTGNFIPLLAILNNNLENSKENHKKNTEYSGNFHQYLNERIMQTSILSQIK